MVYNFQFKTKTENFLCGGLTVVRLNHQFDVCPVYSLSSAMMSLTMISFTNFKQWL